MCSDKVFVGCCHVCGKHGKRLRACKCSQCGGWTDETEQALSAAQCEAKD